MKQLLLLVVTMFLWASCSNQDEPVNQAPEATESQTASRYLSPSEAVKRASEAYENMFGKGSRSTLSGRAYLYNASTGSRSFGTDSVLYVVNFDEGGFAVVPAYRYDDTEAYAIGEHSTFDASQNPAAAAYVDLLCNRALSFRDSTKFDPILQVDTVNGMILPPGWTKGNIYYPDYWFYRDRSATKYENLLSTAWGQDDPYNKFCPKAYDDDANPHVTLAGCIAVGIGQICGYYRVPANEINGYMIDWNNILANHSINNLTLDNQEQLAHLLREIGRLANLAYGIEITTGDLDRAFSAVKKLGYNNAIVSSNISNCFKYVKNIGPCLIIDLTHCWVIDGIMEEKYDIYRALPSNLEDLIPYSFNRKTYIHCNWGWEGFCDGYYLARTAIFTDPHNTISGTSEWNITDAYITAGEFKSSSPSSFRFIINFQ